MIVGAESKVLHLATDVGTEVKVGVGGLYETGSFLGAWELELESGKTMGVFV